MNVPNQIQVIDRKSGCMPFSRKPQICLALELLGNSYFFSISFRNIQSSIRCSVHGNACCSVVFRKGDHSEFRADGVAADGDGPIDLRSRFPFDFSGYISSHSIHGAWKSDKDMAVLRLPFLNLNIRDPWRPGLTSAQIDLTSTDPPPVCSMAVCCVLAFVSSCLYQIGPP